MCPRRRSLSEGLNQNRGSRGITSEEAKLTDEVRAQLDDLYRYQADALRSSLARRVGTTNAEDIVSRAFVKLSEKLAQEPGKNGSDLLGLIVSGLEKNYYRDQSTRLDIPVGLQDDLDRAANTQHIQPGLTFERQQFQQNLDLAVRDLPADEREVFILTELRGLTERDAADVLDISQPTVHRRAEAARTTVRKELIAA